MLLVYADGRLLFFLFNKNNFPEVGFVEYLKVSWFALPFDISALLYTNALFILLLIIPFDFTANKIYKTILKILFLLMNGIALLANTADLAYFDFIHKRTTFEVFKLMSEQADMGALLPLFLKDFWYVFVITILYVFLLHVFFNWVMRQYEKTKTKELNT